MWAGSPFSLSVYSDHSSLLIKCRFSTEKSNDLVCFLEINLYLCGVLTEKKIKKMIQNSTYILLGGIIIRLARLGGSEHRA